MATSDDITPAPSRPIQARNPVILKEMRGRMRGNRALLVITAFLVLMSAFALLLYSSFALSSGTTSGPDVQLAGKIVFGGLVAVELFAVAFIAPAFTAGAISGERERQTYDLLRTTLLPARSLVLGKLGSSLSFVLLLLVAAVPLQGLAFLLGGVAVEEIWIAFIILVVTTLLYGALGLFFSSMMKRTLGASVLTYGVTLLTTVGLPLLLLMMVGFVGPFIGGSGFTTLPDWVEYVLVGSLWLFVCTNPILAGVATEAILVNEQSIWLFNLSMPSGGVMPLPSPWLPYAVFALFLSLILVFFSIVMVRRQEQ